MAKYAQIVFMQDSSEADDLVNAIQDRQFDAVIEYLSGWDYGDGYEVRDESSHGDSDETYRCDGYLLSWNADLRYVGLQRII